MIGNDFIDSYLETVITWILAWEMHSRFFIVHGKGDLWKRSSMHALVKKHIWSWIQHDFLHIKDFSDQLWKIHNIPVAHNPTSINTKTLQQDYAYTDIWSREIATWFSRSPTWSIKICLIENIERLTIWWSNALLKILEDIPDYGICIATSNNIWSVMTTICSRATLLTCHILDDEKMLAHIASIYPDISDDMSAKLLKIAQWRPQRLEKYSQEDIASLVWYVSQWESYVSSSNQLDAFILLQEIYATTLWPLFFSILIGFAVDTKNKKLNTLLIDLQKKTASHVQMDAMLLSLSLTL